MNERQQFMTKWLCSPRHNMTVAMYDHPLEALVGRNPNRPTIGRDSEQESLPPNPPLGGRPPLHVLLHVTHTRRNNVLHPPDKCQMRGKGWVKAVGSKWLGFQPWRSVLYRSCARLLHCRLREERAARVGASKGRSSITTVFKLLGVDNQRNQSFLLENHGCVAWQTNVGPPQKHILVA